jgi:Arc/MetJ-type ribon-helix-helix transcriptional regulator
MTIRLPENVESSIREAVQSGHFASVDDAMTEAAHLLLQKLHRGQVGANPPDASAEASAQAPKPIWDEIDEITAGIPDEEFLKLPVDGAEQHDHYIYGTPKRPPTP